MKEQEPKFKIDGNGGNPRWVIYPLPQGEYEIFGPFTKQTATEIAKDTGGKVYKEVPDLGDKSIVNLTSDD